MPKHRAGRVGGCGARHHVAEFQANGQVRTNLVRFNNDGSVDASFYPARWHGFRCYLPRSRTLWQGSGWRLFQKVNGVVNNYIGRLNDDHSTFNTGSGASDVVYSIVLQPDGKTLCLAAFTDINNITGYGIARFA